MQPQLLFAVAIGLALTVLARRTPVFTVVPHALDVSWSVNHTRDTCTLDLFLRFPALEYCAFGTTPYGANGPVVVCFRNVSVVTCFDAKSDYYSISPRPQTARVVDFEITRACNTVHVSQPCSTWSMYPRAAVRAIYARGLWDASRGAPAPHGYGYAHRGVLAWSVGGSDSFGIMRDYDLGVIQEPGLSWTVALEIVYCLALGLVVLGSVLNRTAFKPWTIDASRSCIAPGLLLLLALTVAACSYESYRLARSAPFARGAARGLRLALPTALLPVTRVFGAVQAAGSSWERAVSLHTVCGVVVGVLIVAHASVMCSKFGRYVLTPGSGPINPLAGVIAAAAFSAVVVTAALRRRNYCAFRSAHWLVFVVLVASVVHCRSIAWFLLPPLAVYAVDAALRHGTGQRSAAIVSCRTLGAVAEIVVHCKLSPSPGQFVLLAVPEVSRVAHPISIAAFDEHRSEVTLLVRRVGPWSSALHNRCEARTLGALQLSRPYGSLQLPIATSIRADVVVVVAGGIGVTPLLSILYHFARCANAPPVHLLWSVRDEGTLSLGWRLLARALDVPCGDHIACRVVVTGNGRAHDCCPLEGVEVVCDSRPSVSRWMRDVTKLCSSGAVYACGPPQMLGEVRSVADALGFSTHTETFVL